MINGKTEIYGVIGHPITHTISPNIHNTAFKQLKMNAVYIAFDVFPENLKKAVDGLKSIGINGFNVTIPHKTSIIPCLDKIDPLAKRISAVNTVKNVNNKFFGFNTDIDGVLNTFQQKNIDINGRKVVLVGAGGAAKAIGFALAPLAKELVILNRTERNAVKLAKSILQDSNTVKGKRLTPQTIAKELEDTQVLINATPIGMHPNSGNSIVKKDLLHDKLTVLDIVYNPIETKLLTDAKSKGAKTLNGLSMLIYQAASSFKIWTNVEINPLIMLKTATKVMKQYV